MHNGSGSIHPSSFSSLLVPLSRHVFLARSLSGGVRFARHPRQPSFGRCRGGGSAKLLSCHESPMGDKVKAYAGRPHRFGDHSLTGGCARFASLPFEKRIAP